MSEAINKLLCDRQQSFTTAEQKIGRDNIGAMASSGMSAYVPFSAISADAGSAITSINGSSVGAGFSGVSSNNYITGDGTTGSPVGLGSAIQFTGMFNTAAVAATSIVVANNTNQSAYLFPNCVEVDNPSYSATAVLSGPGLQLREDGYSFENVSRSSVYSWNHPQYYCKIFHLTNDTSPYFSTADYPSGLTADARMDILVAYSSTVSSYLNLVLDETAGKTASLYASSTSLEDRSATVYYDATRGAWSDFQ